MRPEVVLRLPVLLTGLILVGQLPLEHLWPRAWNWDPQGANSQPVLIAVNAVLGLVLVSAVLGPRRYARRIGLGLAYVIVQSAALLYVAATYPGMSRLVVPGGTLLALGTLTGIALLWELALPEQRVSWLTPTFLWQFGIPVALLVAGALAFAGAGVPDTWSSPLLLVGAVLLVYAIGQFVIVLQVIAHPATEDEIYPKSYLESLRLIANVLVVANGVLLGLIKDATTLQYRPAAMVVLAVGIAVGVFHLTVLVGGVHEEFTLKTTGGSEEKTTAVVKLHPVHSRASKLLLNLQYYSLLVGTVLIAVDWI
jgi:hypothetical protein